MGKRKKVEEITYRTLKAEIRALLDRPGVVPEAEERVLDWLVGRQIGRLEEPNGDIEPLRMCRPFMREGGEIVYKEFVGNKGDLLKKITDESANHSAALVKQIKTMKEQGDGEKVYCTKCRKVWTTDEMIRADAMPFSDGFLVVEINCPGCGNPYRNEFVRKQGE